MDLKTLSFEDCMSRLETIVRLLERGDATLSDSLKLYEEGASLISRSSEMLEKAEQKVVKLRKRADGLPEEVPFEDE